MKIILASNSPRRKELLSQVGIDIEVIPADIDENISETNPTKYVMTLSQMKANAIYQSHSGKYIVAADTVVVYDNQILGKPTSIEDAERMLTMLSGNIHQVYTGVTVISPDGKQHTFYECTDVEMFENSSDLIHNYVLTGEPMDKAGAYGIQGMGTILIKRISGDYNNVVGLPLSKVFRYLMSSEPLHH